jgi:MFS transporter, DHA1 family, inner membrane transport protein
VTAADDAGAQSPDTSRFPLPILALTLAAFAIGTAEFVIAGLLPDIARDLAVSIPAAGQLVTVYAIGVVIGAPVMAILTAQMPRKSVLLLMLCIFVLGNLLSALSPNYTVLALARIVAALAHGSLFGVGVVVAANLVPETKRASAIALMFSGLTIANLAGVPLGTLVGQNFGWRATFFSITALGLISLLTVAMLIPSVAGGGAIDLRSEFAVARRPKVLLALLTTVLGWACVFTLFTYIVPILEGVSGFAPATVTAILFVIGAGLTIGITLGGKLADRGLMKALTGTLAALVVLSLGFAALCGYPAAAVMVIFIWGMAAFATVPPLQTRILDTAKEAPNVASSLNVAAFNLGNAAGALAGGAVLNLGLGLRAPPIAAAFAAALGLAATVYGIRLDRREPVRKGGK